MKLFQKTKEYTKPNGVKVTKFVPSAEVYIKSINLETGDISDKLVTEYSKHENLKMYKIHDTFFRFKDFWVSEDHSLIVLNYDTNKLEKISPLTILDNPSNYSLVQQDDIDDVYYLDCSYIDIFLDPEKTVAYDFTVEDNYTFCTDDGVFVQDTMAIYAPITREAIEEARSKMITSSSKDSMHSLSDEFSKDLVVGTYLLTRDPLTKFTQITIKSEDQINELHPNALVKYGTMNTTAGRVLFNRIMPPKYPFINQAVNKGKLNSLALEIYEKYDKQVYIKWTTDIIKLSMYYYTILSPSFSLEDFKLSPKILKLKASLATATIQEAALIIENIQKELEIHLEKSGSNLNTIHKAGGSKGMGQIGQILVAKGIVSDSDGNPMPPISHSWGDGLSSKEFFYSGIGARSGIIDRVINTADTGYLSRQLVYALQRVEADPRIKDCKTTKTYTLRVTSDLVKKLDGRFVVEKGKIVQFDPKLHSGQLIELRSPIYCKSPKLCYTCYGDLLYKNRSLFVGVMAGQILGEPLTQAIMRTFHTGGAVEIKTINIVSEISKTLHEDESRKLNSLVTQNKSNLITKADGKILIAYKDYMDYKKDIVRKETTYDLQYGYFRMIISGFQVDVILDSEVIIPVKDKVVEHNDLGITISFKANDIVFDCPPKGDAFSAQVNVIQSLLNGKQPWKSPDHFTTKIYNIYSSLAKRADLVHIEVLASNLLRDKSNPAYPARLNPNYDAIVENIKNIPAHESWLSSLQFENFGKSIMQGLVYDRPEDESILERIVTGSV